MNCGDGVEQVTTLNWVESAGGSLVVVPRAKVTLWSGAASPDYALANSIDDYLGVLDMPWGLAVVLNDQNFRTAVGAGGIIVRWMFAPDEATLLEVLGGLNWDVQEPVERLWVQLPNEPHVIFDSGRPGSEPAGIKFEPPPSTEVLTYVIEDPNSQVRFIAHRFV